MLYKHNYINIIEIYIKTRNMFHKHDLLIYLTITEYIIDS